METINKLELLKELLNYTHSSYKSDTLGLTGSVLFFFNDHAQQLEIFSTSSKPFIETKIGGTNGYLASIKYKVLADSYLTLEYNGKNQLPDIKISFNKLVFTFYGMTEKTSNGDDKSHFADYEVHLATEQDEIPGDRI